MKIVDNFFESDLFTTLPFSKEVFKVDLNVLNGETFEDLKFIENVRTVFNQRLSKNNDVNKEQDLPSLKLKELKTFQSEMEEWMIDNLNYPFKMVDFYQALINTLSIENQSQNSNRFTTCLIACFHDSIQKMLKYEKNKSVQYVKSNAILNSLLEENGLLNKDVYKQSGYDVKQNNEKKEQQSHYSKPYNTSTSSDNKKQYSSYKKDYNSKNFEKKAYSNFKNKAEEKNTSKNQQQFDKNAKSTINAEIEKNIEEQNKVNLDRSLYLDCINKTLNLLKVKIVNENQGKQVGELEPYVLNAYSKVFLTKINEIHSRLKNGHNYSEQEIVSKLLLPSINQFDKDFLLLWKTDKDNKIILNKETLATGLFWKEIKQIEDKACYEWLPSLVKLDDYNQEEKFKVVFETLAMITCNEELFKDRIRFFEELGFSILENQSFAKVIKNEKEHSLKVQVVSENDLKYDPKIENKTLYQRATVSDLLLQQNNPKWNQIISELKIKQEQEKSNKRTLNIKF